MLWNPALLDGKGGRNATVLQALQALFQQCLRRRVGKGRRLHDGSRNRAFLQLIKAAQSCSLPVSTVLRLASKA